MSKSVACFKEMFYEDTGGGNRKTYRLELGRLWTAVSASFSAAVARDGGQRYSYSCEPVIRIDGPFVGDVELLDGGIRIVPTEWADRLGADVVAIQLKLVPQNLQSCVQLTPFKG